MSLVPSLLQAIVQLDGDALVMHVGDKPYVVSPTGQVDLATRGVSLEAVVGVVNQLLPLESQHALDEFGAAQYVLPPMPEFPGEQFTIVAARGGDDLWTEIRRRRVPDEDRVPLEAFESAVVVASEIGAGMRADAEPPAPAADTDTETETTIDDDLLLPDSDQLFPPPMSSPDVQAAAEGAIDLPLGTPGLDEERAMALSPEFAAAGVGGEALIAPHVSLASSASSLTPPDVARDTATASPALDQPSRPAETLEQHRPVSPPAPQISPTPPVMPPPAQGVVLPLSRNPVRGDVPPPLAEQALAGLDRLLRLAAARGASTLYLSSASRPSIRVDGEIQPLDGAPLLGPNEVESLLLTLMPERSAEALRTGVASEWICELPEVGRVRCMSFRDHRGPGGVFRIMPSRAVGVEQLGLSREIQALGFEPEGLVLVSGPRSSGKRTLISAFVDLINRTRHDHVITIESEINFSHERNGSFISQREVRGGLDEMVAVARAALREDPDVLVLEELRSPALMDVALDAAGSGQLVIGGFPAHSASSAIDRIIDLYPPEQRRHVQLSLAQNLRGVVAQVLLRKTSGGRVAAREVLLNTPAVASVLAEGKTSQLPLAIEGGRRQGMVPLNDALVGFVQSGVVEVGEAYKRAVDRAGFVALLKRQGIDTSAIERYA